MMGEGVEMVEEPLEVDGTELIATCLSVGNPHCVIFVDRVNEAPVQELGSRIENNPLFPHRTNVEFVETVSRNHLKVRVWERGVGETLACGTGACAAFAAGLRTERTGQEVTVELPGGSLDIRVDDHGHIHMAGTVVEVFRGRLSKAWLERR
jgi:diaminopimelate epimerase